MEKNAKKQKKTRRFSKSFTSYLHNHSILEHNLNRFWKLQCRATTIVSWEISPKKECACPKREIDTDKLQNKADILQKSDIDYKVY